MDADLDTLATALYVRTDDLLKEFPERAPWRPAAGIIPKLSDAEVPTLAVMQALLGYASESRWLRYARRSLRWLFPCLPGQSGSSKRLRKLAGTLAWLIRALARDTSTRADDVWVVDSTPVECGRSRDTARRSDLAGYARVRVLRQPLPLVLGAAAAPAVHAARPAGRVRAGRRQGR